MYVVSALDLSDIKLPRGLSKLDVTYLMCAACVSISVQFVLKISVGGPKGEIRMWGSSIIIAVHLAFV